jgi:hypothetical protein
LRAISGNFDTIVIATTLDAFITFGLVNNKQLDNDIHKFTPKDYIPELTWFPSIFCIQYGRRCFVHQFITSLFAIWPITTGKS